MASRLSDRLLAGGLAPGEMVRAAIARQAVYGGALDTALLEIDALTEAPLWKALAAATDLPVPDRALCESPEKVALPAGAAIELDGAWSSRCRAVPVGRKDGALQVLCGEPVARAELDAASSALGIPFTLYVAPEIWVAAVQQAVFDRPMAPRLVRLFARVVGAQPVRRWQASYAPEIAPELPAAIERLAPRAPAPVSPPPPPPARAAAPPNSSAPAPAASAAARLDKAAIPDLIERLEMADDPVAAQEALVAITKQDLGSRPKRWAAWWERHQNDDRVDWLFEGLSHKTTEIRATSEQELRALTGEYFGYHFDLPRRDREAARARWQAWWSETWGRAR
ncbi:MAG TPA: hypothetical protein VFG23_13150 [Polyangia bacterium]|nr:hypothetical protein [Polyangia bacterium]